MQLRQNALSEVSSGATHGLYVNTLSETDDPTAWWLWPRCLILVAKGYDRLTAYGPMITMFMSSTLQVM